MSTRRWNVRLRRIALRVVVLLLLGAVVNVAVVWGCVAGSSLTLRDFGSPQSEYGLWCFWWYQGFGEDIVVLRGMCHISAKRNVPEHVQITPWKQREVVDQHFIRSGWPMYAASTVGTLQHRWGTEPRPELGEQRYKPKWRLGIDLPQRWDGELYYRALPIEPIWPGFAINTLFYAAIPWLLFAAPGSMRRWRRIRRGLCAKCAYPVGTSDVCTECGAAVKTLGLSWRSRQIRARE
jgi:hypothetical protein